MATFRLDLDLDKSPRIGARVRVRQGDVESCVIEASVFDAGAQADLSGKSARFCCLKPDRTMVRDASCEINGNVITHTLDQQVSAAAGLIELAYFEVLDASGSVIDSTQAFTIEVEEGAEAGSSGVSQSYYSELDDLIARYEQAIKQSQSDYEAAESARDQSFQQAEAARDAAQDANDERQSANDAAQAKNNADQQLNNQMAQGLQVVILTDGQYDPGTLEPTVSGEAGNLYFVPTGEADEEDAYVEWMWVGSAWERVGMSNATIEAVTTDQIDSVVADGSPQGKQVLNLTGLSYLWAKVKAWATGAFAALSHTHPASQVTGLTASRALVSDSSGHPAASAVTATELGYLDGVTSGVQGQIDALGDSLSQAPLLTRLHNTVETLAPGSSTTVSGISGHGFVLVMAYADPNGARSSVLMTSTNSNAAIPAGGATQLLNVNGNTIRALSTNTATVYLYRVFGVDLGV